MVNKFTLPGIANTIVGDSKYVYATLTNDKSNLYGYKLDSDGILLGQGYSTSTNVSVPLPISTIEDFTMSVVFQNYLFLGATPNLIFVVNTDTMAMLNVFNIMQVPQFLAVDKFGFIYVSAGAEIINVFNFINGDTEAIVKLDLSNGGPQAAECGFCISSTDHLYFSLSSLFINTYTIARDSLNRPVSLNRIGFVNEDGCVFALGIDKWGSVVAVDGIALDVTDNTGLEGIYCLPNNVNTLQMWIDPEFGYAYFVSSGYSGNGNIYTVSYPQPSSVIV